MANLSFIPCFVKDLSAFRAGWKASLSSGMWGQQWTLAHVHFVAFFKFSYNLYSVFYFKQDLFFLMFFLFSEETHSLVYLKQAEMQPIVLVLTGAKMRNETLDVWYESKINGR